MALKIAFITEEYPPMNGGVGVSAQRITTHLVKEGCEVALFTFDASKPLHEPDYCHEAIIDGVGVHRVGPFYLRQPGVDPEKMSESQCAMHLRRVFDEIERRLSTFQPDVVVSFYAAHAGLLGGYLAQVFQVPHIAGVRGNDVGRNIFGTTSLARLRQITALSSHVVCVNEYLMKRFIMAFPEFRARTSMIQNSVDLPAGIADPVTRTYLSAHTGWQPTDVVAVFIGFPREKKGISQLLHAVEEAARTSPLKLLIVGSAIRASEHRVCGDVWARLHQEGKLYVTGQLDRALALKIAAEGDLVVMPSLEDGMANGLLEGMALGLCPLVSDIFADLIEDRRNGMVAERNNINQLAQHLRLLAGDGALRRRLAAEAKASVNSRPSPREESNAYARLIRSVVAAHAEGRDVGGVDAPLSLYEHK
jgi:glycosyltransferase involved in cell wall biosynthesis